uniref:Putative conserved secreted protein n=1 Tax=Phlebotomus kandelakii TaxID=1109342 RepID=A0A6B2E741_9DIPT
MNLYSGVILSVVAVFSLLVTGNTFNPLPADFGARLSQQIKTQVQESLSGLEHLNQLQYLGAEISQNVQTHLDNQFWFRGPNVCFTETVDDLPPSMYNFGFGSQISQSCNVFNEEYVCTTIETRDGYTQRKTKIYKCCEDSSLGRIGEKIRCLKNDY